MKRIFAVLIAAMLMLTVFAGCASSEAEAENGSAVALKIGNTEYTVNDVQYMYVATFNEVYYNLYYTYSSYGIDVSTIVDISKPLEEQMVDETKTWHEYVLDYTVNTLKSITGVYEEAIANGFVLPEEYQTDLDSFSQQLEEIAAKNSMTKEEYIENSYGKGVTEETVRKMTEIQIYCNAYIQDYQGKVTVSDEDIQAYYEANKKDIDTVAMRFFFTPTYSDEEGSEYTHEQAKAAAEAVAAAQNAEEFDNLAYENADEEQKKSYDEGGSTLMQGITYNGVGIEEVSEWLFDEARQYGDTYTFHDVEYSSYLIVMFEERVDPNYDYIDVRHILITPEEDEEGNISDEAWTAAEEKANEIYEGFLAGEQTEEAFGELAKEHSADGNAAQGGIYEDVKKGQMVETFNNWCFDEARQPGDSGIVKTRFGYHIMYFVGTGTNNLTGTIEPSVTSEKVSAWIENFSVNAAEERTEAFDTIDSKIDDIVAAANDSASNETEVEKADNASGIIIAALIVIIIVCIVIILRNGKGKKNAETAETEAEAEETEESVLPEATDEELTEEELLAEEAFEEGASEEEPAEEASEETAEEAEEAEETEEKTEE
ncbi:MAG: peptidylprolyl isomerase [Oscillospiraceae bacterium]|nr:peptidylprolyl isomerase [Oscillospiraceae bacterium]